MTARSELEAGGFDVNVIDTPARLLVEVTREGAERHNEKLEPPRWDGNWQREGVYCLACAKELFPDSIDGGWVGEEDCPIRCEKCGKPLDYIFTDVGTERSLDSFEEFGIETDSDCYQVHRMMNAGGHPLLTESCGDFHYRVEWKDRIKALYDKLTEKEK